MTILFTPLLPVTFLWPLLIFGAILSLLGLYTQTRGILFRSLALLALGIALFNPTLQTEEREALSTIVPIVVDHSASQATPERRQQTDATLAQLQEQLARFPGLEPRIVKVEDDPSVESPSTRLFSALSNAIVDVPASRVGAAIFITDGQIHDIPAEGQKLSFAAPVHGLITGRDGEFDRRIDIVRAPRFGIVGEQQEVTFRVLDDGPPSNVPADVTVRMNGATLGDIVAVPGRTPAFRSRFRVAAIM